MTPSQQVRECSGRRVSDPLATIKTLVRAGVAADLDRLSRLWADEPTSPEFHALIHDIAGAA